MLKAGSLDNHPAVYFTTVLASIGVVLLIGGIIFELMNLDYGMLGNCYFKKLTGYPCLTCGSTRAIRKLVVLRVRTAFWSNPLLTLWLIWSALYFFWAALVAVFKFPTPRVIYESKNERRAMAAIFVTLMIVNWIYLIQADI
jgi:Protein of unknown function (DUF2752)